MLVVCLSLYFPHVLACATFSLVGLVTSKKKRKRKRKKEKKASPAFQTVFGGRTSERDRYAVGFVSFLCFAFAFFFLLSLDKKTWRALSLEKSQSQPTTPTKRTMLLLLLHTIWEGEKERWGVTWVAWKVKQFCKEKTEL